MKLNKNFFIHRIDNETVIVPTRDADFSGIVKGNKTLGAIAELLKDETTEQQIVDAMLQQYDASREEIEQDVFTTINKLRTIGAIDE